MKLSAAAAFFALIFCVPAHAEYSGAFVPTPPAGPIGQDLSASYFKLLKHENSAGAWPAFTDAQKEKLRQYYVLFVPDFLSDYAETHMVIFGYEMNLLDTHGFKRGVDYGKLTSDTGFSGEGGPSYNAPAIAKAILEAPRPVLLVSHSKGAVDILQAFVQFPEIRQKVGGWISMQGAVWGSPMADIVCRSFEDGIYEWILSFSTGSGDALESLRQDVRADFMNKHMAEISSLPQSFPVLSFASVSKPNDQSDWLNVLNYLYGSKMKAQTHGLNDGLVPLNNAIVPGSNYVVMPDFDHFQYPGPYAPFPALLSLLFFQ